MRLVRVIDQWLTELPFFSFVSSISPSLIPCTSIHSSGSSICSPWGSKMRLNLLFQKKDSITWIRSLRTAYMRTFVGHCLRNINFYSHSCWPIGFYQVWNRWMICNGDSYWLDRLGIYRYKWTQPHGSVRMHGLKHIDNSIPWIDRSHPSRG